jgi:hypothetical protein
MTFREPPPVHVVTVQWNDIRPILLPTRKMYIMDAIDARPKTPSLAKEFHAFICRLLHDCLHYKMTEFYGRLQREQLHDIVNRLQVAPPEKRGERYLNRKGSPSLSKS